MSSPAFTVVVPLYQKAATIRRALESVLAQTFGDLEVVVVDDGSTDGGGDAARAVKDPRVKVLAQANAGVSAARNRGIAEARGASVAFLDADDVHKPEFLALIRELQAKYPGAGAYGTSFEKVRADGSRSVWRTPLLRGGAPDVLIEDYFREALAGPVLWTSAAAVPRATFAAAGRFPEGVRLGEDLDLWMRIGARFPVAVSGAVGAVYRQDAENRADDGRSEPVDFELVKTGLRLLSSGEVRGEAARHLREYVAHYQLNTASELVLAGERARARELLARCETSRFGGRRLWWRFWALLPTPVTLAAQKAKRALRGAS